MNAPRWAIVLGVALVVGALVYVLRDFVMDSEWTERPEATNTDFENDVTPRRGASRPRMDDDNASVVHEIEEEVTTSGNARPSPASRHRIQVVRRSDGSPLAGVPLRWITPAPQLAPARVPWNREVELQKVGHPLQSGADGMVALPDFEGTAWITTASADWDGDLVFNAELALRDPPITLAVDSAGAVIIEVVDAEGRPQPDLPIGIWQDNERYARLSSRFNTPIKHLVWRGVTDENGKAIARRALANGDRSTGAGHIENQPIAQLLRQPGRSYYAALHAPPELGN
ncbi:MAG: hypothetical protein KDB53_07960, partial [Planctomycetes bacterium]|nr:hypothetical protein [Planctomycetota bacterium]